MSTYTPTSSRMRTRVVHTQTRRQPHQPSNQATNQPTRSKPNNQQSSERTFIVFVRGRVRDGRLKTLASWKKTHTDRTKRETNRKQKKKKNTKHTNTQANKRTGTPSQEMLLDGGWLFGVGRTRPTNHSVIALIERTTTDRPTDRPTDRTNERGNRTPN